MPARHSNVPNGPRSKVTTRTIGKRHEGEGMEGQNITMNCNEFEEQMFAFLNGELDETKSVKVQQHVDHCICCMLEMETAQDIGKRLTATWLDDDIVSALATLGPVDRRIIFLSSTLEMSYENIAADLKCSVSAITSGMIRSRRALRLCLSGSVGPKRRKTEKSNELQ